MATTGVGGATWVHNWSRWGYKVATIGGGGGWVGLHGGYNWSGWGYKVATIGVGGATRWPQLEWVGLHGGHNCTQNILVAISTDIFT